MINVVDLFAGPGGLGEGFSACEIRQGGRLAPAFRLSVSAEMDPAAHRTLRLRAFYRQLLTTGKSLDSYYAFLADPVHRAPFSDRNTSEWDHACREALNLTLGNAADNGTLHDAIAERVGSSDDPWILVGGPPCQAYSVVGRARNQGNSDYSAEKDHRHFLYREYLQILQRFSPDAFILENVRGVLSSKVSGQRIFEQMLEDLSSPSKALGKHRGPSYDIVPLADPREVASKEPDQSSRYLIYSERHGIPQTRHRVILLGIRRGSGLALKRRLALGDKVTVKHALKGLPRLRSGLTDRVDDSASWFEAVSGSRSRLISLLEAGDIYSKLVDDLRSINIPKGLSRGEVSLDLGTLLAERSAKMPERLAAWLLDPRLAHALNHETRSHLGSDLDRYMFSSAFMRSYKKNATSKDFPSALAPNHSSWSEGKFADRFRTQGYEQPAGTITSHISKDGHHFIHPDPAQCRSLTVREAARLQTFPDNYFFMGNRTQQYTQVGNAVPPLLARQIADLVAEMFA